MFPCQHILARHRFLVAQISSNRDQTHLNKTYLTFLSKLSTRISWKNIISHTQGGVRWTGRLSFYKNNRTNQEGTRTFVLIIVILRQRLFMWLRPHMSTCGSGQDTQTHMSSYNGTLHPCHHAFKWVSCITLGDVPAKPQDIIFFTTQKRSWA